MKIVASNSITVSNVNDGTITHIAYANSADGTDGFYIGGGRNLLNNTDKDISVTSHTTDGYPAWANIDTGFSFEHGKTYTFSAEAKNSTDKIAEASIRVFENSTNTAVGIYAFPADGKRHSITFTIPNDSHNYHLLLYAGHAGIVPGIDITTTYHHQKLEEGNISTPWSPAPSEAHPSYIGQYTDFNTTASTDPTKYAPWIVFKGIDGKDGHDGIAGKDGVGLRSTTITYTISSSGTVTPTTGWTSQVPTLVKGQYLWTKTVWTYTDNTSETGYSVSYIAQDGNNGHDGIAGKDGTGIKTTTITYAGSTSGTTAPTSGWVTTVPTVAAGSYLWTKTVWAYTDNTSETGYSVAKMGNTGATGPQGPQGNTGPQGPAGSNGDPGKIVSDTEPSTRFKGLTWKYSGTSDLTASDGTVIKPNTEYYYNGTHWMINYLSANNLEANSIKADKIDAKNLTITDGEFVSTTTNGPVTTSTEIKDNHIAISKTDGTVNTKNDLAVDTEQGFAMKFTNNTTGLTREASVNFQGVSTSDSNGNYAQLTPQGTKLSTDVPWTDITRASGVGTSGTLRARINNGVFYAQSKDVTIPSIAPNSLITIGTMSSKFSGVSGFDTLGLLYSPGQLSVASVTVGNDGKINIGNPNPTTMSGKVIQFSINIPLG